MICADRLMSDVSDHEGLFGFGLKEGYKGLPGVTDEMVDAKGDIRPHWHSFSLDAFHAGPA